METGLTLITRVKGCFYKGLKVDYTRFFSSETQYMKASEIRELLKLTEGKNVISLAGGLPDPSTFPREELAEIAKYVIEEYGSKALQYGPTKGVTLYRQALTDFLYRNRQIKADAEDIVVTTGSQQALDIIARTLINPGDYVVVEEPTYLAALNAFRIRRPNFIGVPIDDDGMKVDVLEEKLRKVRSEGKQVKLLYTVPIAQNPSGVTLSYERKKRLLELAEEYDFLIVEDDVYGLLVYRDDVDTRPLSVMDKSGRVIYLGSFSKILSPGMRLGHIVAPRPLVDLFERAKQSMDLHSPSLTQYIAAEAIRRRVIENNLPRIKRLYIEKRDAMLQALDEYFIKSAWWTKPIGGMFVWVKLNANIDTSQLLFRAIEQGVAYVPGKSFFHDLSGKDTMRLNFTYPGPELIRKGIEILAKVVKEALGVS